MLYIFTRNTYNVIRYFTKVYVQKYSKYYLKIMRNMVISKYFHTSHIDHGFEMIGICVINEQSENLNQRDLPSVVPAVEYTNILE